MPPTRCAAFLVASISLLALPARAAGPTHPAEPAHPAPTAGQLQAARDLFAAATKDEDAQRWADALDKLHRVAEVKLTASVRYHAAFCEEKLGLSATALAHYTEALDAAQRENNRNVQELLKPPFIADLRTRVPTLTLDVPSDVPAVEVSIDGQPHPHGLWSAAVPVDPGTHRIEAHAPGREPFVRALTLHEREITVLDVTLPPVAKTEAALGPPTLITPTRPAVPSPAAQAPPAPPSPAPAQPSDARRPITAAVATTVGAVLMAGGGVGAFVLAGNAQSSGANQCVTRTTSCDDLRTPVRAWDAVALGAWIGAAALTTTALVLWTTPAKGGHTPRQTGLSVRITTSGSLLRLEGSF
jgi:hypothetical protein